MLITTRAAIKDFIGITTSENDIILSSIATAVSAHIERYLRRQIEIKERVKYFDVDKNQKVFSFDAYPVSACVIYNDTLRVFESPITNSYYTFLGDNGELAFDDCYELLTGNKVLKAVYTGGMASTQEELLRDFPDIEMAARIQGDFWYERRKRLGISSESMNQTTTQFNKLELLPTVKESLEPHRRKNYVC